MTISWTIFFSPRIASPLRSASYRCGKVFLISISFSLSQIWYEFARADCTESLNGAVFSWFSFINHNTPSSSVSLLFASDVSSFDVLVSQVFSSVFFKLFTTRQNCVDTYVVNAWVLLKFEITASSCGVANWPYHLVWSVSPHHCFTSVRNHLRVGERSSKSAYSFWFMICVGSTEMLPAFIFFFVRSRPVDSSIGSGVHHFSTRLSIAAFQFHINEMKSLYSRGSDCAVSLIRSRVFFHSGKALVVRLYSDGALNIYLDARRLNSPRLVASRFNIWSPTHPWLFQNTRFCSGVSLKYADESIFV